MLRKFIASSFFIFSSYQLLAAHFSVTAKTETTPVVSAGDAADDSAFWYNSQRPEKSYIIGTDKRKGLIVYDLKGKKISEYTHFPYNNVDVKSVYDIKNKTKKKIIAANNKKTGWIDFFTLVDGQIKALSGFIKPKVNSYGLCLLDHYKRNQQFVIITGRNENADLFRIWLEGDEVKEAFVKTLPVDSKNEGCVADDFTGDIFVAEEKGNIWLFSPDARSRRKELADSSQKNPNLVEDIEGLTIYYTDERKGYLIASVQGKSEFALYDRENLRYLRSFKIISSDIVDRVTGTDGIDVMSFSLGSDYPKGMLVVQDDVNTESGRIRNQNFKLVDWSVIESELMILQEKNK